MHEELHFECGINGHDWNDTVECLRCGDDRCGVKCANCDQIEWACDE